MPGHKKERSRIEGEKEKSSRSLNSKICPKPLLCVHPRQPTCVSKVKSDKKSGAPVKIKEKGRAKRHTAKSLKQRTAASGIHWKGKLVIEHDETEEKGHYESSIGALRTLLRGRYRGNGCPEKKISRRKSSSFGENALKGKFQGEGKWGCGTLAELRVQRGGKRVRETLKMRAEALRR